MLIRALALGFFPLNFTSNLGGKTILEWENNGKVPAGLSRSAITRRMQRYHDQKVSELSISLDCFKHNEEDEREATNSLDPNLLDRLLSLQQDIWSNAAQVFLLI